MLIKEKLYKMNVRQQNLLKILTSHPVSAIISDQRMPHMTGVELLEKSIKSAPQAVRILITAYSDIDVVIQAINSGKIYHFESKPWDRVRLRNTVQKGIEAHELTLKIEEQNKTLKEINSELKKAYERLAELDRAKDQFINVISHELKTPLTSIIGFTEALLSGEDDQKMTRTSLEFIKQSSDRLLSVIEDVLLLTALEAHQYQLQSTTNDISLIVSNVLAHYQKEIDALQLHVTHHVKKNVQVSFDPRLLHIVFLKILHNAIKYNKQAGSIEIDMISSTTGIDMLINNRGGIDIKTRRILFNKFVTVDNMKYHRGGMGLGLPIARAIMEYHGGLIAVSNPSKHETSVTLHFLSVSSQKSVSR